MPDVIQIESGAYSTCAITASQELWCWGMFQTWRAPMFERARRITEVPEVFDVAMGGVVGVSDLSSSLMGSMCVLERCGRVRCWGDNQFGTLGDGTTTDSAVPVEVTGWP